MPISSNRLRPGAVALAAASLSVAIVACSGDEPPSAERFCGEIEANLAALTSPDLTFVDDIEPVLDLYRDIGDLAPLAIDAEWRQLIVNYETASTVVPDDPESLQRAVNEAYRSEQSAARVDRWLQDNCALSMGPLSTLVPQGG